MTTDEAVQLLLDGFVISVRDLLQVRAVWLHGSLALGDYQAGRSDLDLIVVLDAPIADSDALALVARHRSLERAHPLADKLHCSYLQVDQLADASLHHPTWAHRQYFDRPVTAVTRRELALGDCALYGPPPSALLPVTTDEELTAFVRHDLGHFWYPAALKRKRWYTDVWVDHGPIVVARAGVTLTEGRLITKRSALDLLPSLGLPTAVTTDIESRRYPSPGSHLSLDSQPSLDSHPSPRRDLSALSRWLPLGRLAPLIRPSPLWRLRRGNLARKFVRTRIEQLLAEPANRP